MRVRYTGNPGYIYQPDGFDSFEPTPGQVLDLPDELVATLGAEFEATSGPASKDPEKFDVDKAKKGELVEFAAGHQIPVDPSAPVADIRAAVKAALEAAAPADGDTPTGQEG